MGDLPGLHSEDSSVQIGGMLGALHPSSADLLRDHMDRMISNWDCSVPDYASYPSPECFHTDFMPEIYEGWLSRLPAELNGKPLSLYVHIPFTRADWGTECGQACSCRSGRFHTHHRFPLHQVDAAYDSARLYVQSLLYEIDRIAEMIPGRQPVSQIYFGGGAADFLVPQDLQRICNRIKRRFAVYEDAEITMEVDPQTADTEEILELAGYGVNRVVLHVLDFHPGVLEALGRNGQNETQIRALMQGFSAGGVRHIDFAMMYGLPMQTEDRFESSMMTAGRMHPSRILLRGYRNPEEGGHGWSEDPERRRMLPDAARRYHLFRVAGDALNMRGYTPIGTDHFVRNADPLVRAMRKGKLAYNMLGYSFANTGATIGFGAAAITALPQGMIRNADTVGGYQDRLALGDLPVAKGLKYYGEDRLRREKIHELLCYFRTHLRGLSKAEQGTVLEKLRPYITAEMVAIRYVDDDFHLIVRERGRAFVRAICTALDSYYDAYLQGYN